MLPSVAIRQIIRPMRGGSQSRLVEGADAKHYVAKFRGNPQGNRRLINEWIAYRVLEHFGVCTPPLRVLDLPADLCSTTAGLFFEGRSILPGTHLGSQCPVDPETTAIFDFLPRKLLGKVINLNDFAKVFTLDILLGQKDRRQAVFVREQIQGKVHFRAHFIDHGGILGGENWELVEGFSGIYHDASVYHHCPASIWVKALAEAREISSELLCAAASELPSDWFGEDDLATFSRLLLALSNRQAILSDLVRNQLAILGIRVDCKEDHMTLSPPHECLLKLATQ